VRIPKACCVISLFVLLSSANAAVLTFQFSGNVTQVPLDEVFGDLNPGDLIQGTFSFDTSATDAVPADPSIGSYTSSAPLGMDVTIGTHNFKTSGGLNIGILNGVVDQYTVLATSASGDLTLELFLQDNTGSAFSNDHLPLTPPALTDFAQRDFHLIATLAGGEVQADGQLGATAVATPEPPTAGFILAGSIFLLPAVRKRFSQHK
jgi:hypothetical protein